MPDTVYTDMGREFRFNDVVEFGLVMPPRAAGRLVQVRRKVGQFGTDQYVVRHADGSLATVENVYMRHSNKGVPVFDEDATDVTYTIKGDYPETGFIVEEPSQPQTPGTPFAITVVTKP